MSLHTVNVAVQICIQAAYSQSAGLWSRGEADKARDPLTISQSDTGKWRREETLRDEVARKEGLLAVAKTFVGIGDGRGGLKTGRRGRGV